MTQASPVFGKIAWRIADVDHSANEISTSSGQGKFSAEELAGLTGTFNQLVGRFQISATFKNVISGAVSFEEAAPFLASKVDQLIKIDHLHTV